MLMATSISMSLCFGQGMAEKEASARMERTTDAQQLLMQGDVSYSAGKFADATAQYLKARNLLPDAPATQELRNAATERFATASIEAAKELSRKGDVEGAQKMIAEVLAEDIAPRHGGALALRDQLFDPIRTNPALTKEHAKDVDEVRRTLYEADGFFQLGKFDMAKSMYHEVLRIDPTNTAARRGLEKTAHEISRYAHAAQNQTRAAMLQEVDAQWETPVPNFSESVIADPTGTDSTVRVQFIGEKMRQIIFPTVDLADVGIEEAIDFMRTQSRALDNTTTIPVEKGLNIVLNLGDQGSPIGQQVRGQRFSIKLQNVPAATLLKYICDQTRTQFTIDEFAVNIRPLGTDDVQLVGRSYKVPPDFLSADSVGPAAAAPVDPFDEKPEEGLSARRVTAVEKLRTYGVSFPDGAQASFNGTSSTLFVLNTAMNHDLIQQVVDNIAQTEPVQVVIRVTMIKILEKELNELSFDWQFGNIEAGNTGQFFLGGGTVGNGGAINDMRLALPNNNPVTAGNRSGTQAIPLDGIDALIQKNTSGFGEIPQRAPGILSVFATNLGFGQAEMMMRGLGQKKSTDFMTRPAVITRSGQTARVEIIQEFIYPTEYEPPELPNTVGGGQFIDLNTGNALGQNVPLTPITPAMPTSFEPRNLGVTLEVNPVVSADRRYIELALKPEVVNFDGFVNYGTPIRSGGSFSLDSGGITENSSTFGEVTSNRILQPVFSILRADTSVTIADGATIVLGGMVEERIQNVNDKTPVLSELPLLGRFFQSNIRQPIRRNVLVMVQVELQDPSGKPYRTR
jgi:general secretion pathway protein D